MVTKIVICLLSVRSIGGGQIMITEVDGNDMSITGDEFTLVVFHEDRPGAISLISQALSESDINIATMRVFVRVSTRMRSWLLLPIRLLTLLQFSLCASVQAFKT